MASRMQRLSKNKKSHPAEKLKFSAPYYRHPRLVQRKQRATSQTVLHFTRNMWNIEFILSLATRIPQDRTNIETNVILMIFSYN